MTNRMGKVGRMAMNDGRRRHECNNEINRFFQATTTLLQAVFRRGNIDIVKKEGEFCEGNQKACNF